MATLARKAGDALLLMTMLLACACPVAARDIEGVVLPERHSLGSVALQLNGAGVRSKWFLDLYVAGLYLESPSREARQVVEDDRPMLLQLEILSGMITSAKMEKATREGFGRATAAGYRTEPGQIDAFIDVFREEIKPGDRFTLAYLPGSGVTVSKNGAVRATLTGLPFKKALFAIWLGPEPAQEDLRARLLGAGE